MPTAQDDPFAEGDNETRAGPESAAHGVDWDAVRHDYLHSGMSQRRIAWKHGTTAGTLRKYKRAGGWERVAPLERLPTRRKRPGGGEPPTPGEKRRARMVKRLFAALDAKIAVLEARMTNTNDSEHDQSAADVERDTRSLNTLAQLYAKLMALDTTNDRSGPTSPTKDDKDADPLRRDLADRLTRLDRAGDA